MEDGVRCHVEGQLLTDLAEVGRELVPGGVEEGRQPVAEPLCRVRAVDGSDAGTVA